MSKETKQKPEKDFIDSDWFLFLIIIVTGFISIFIIK